MGISEYTKRLEQYRPALANLTGLLLMELSRDYVTQLYAAKKSRKYTRSMNKTIELIHYMHNNYSNKITGEKIENELLVSFDHLNRIFKQIYGQTIFSYLTQIRINHAKDQFDLMDIDAGQYGKWTTKKYALPELKRILSKWQTDLRERAWNSLFWGNHDQPRAVSRFGDTSNPVFWNKSAKMLATCLMFMQGTPYIYQGDELKKA